MTRHKILIQEEHPMYTILSVTFYSINYNKTHSHK